MKFLLLYTAGSISILSIFLLSIIKKNFLHAIMLFLILLPIIYQSRRALYFIFGPFIITPSSIIILFLFLFLIIFKKITIIKKDFFFLLFLISFIFLQSLFSNDTKWALRGFQMIILEPFLLYLIVTNSITDSIRLHGHSYTMNVLKKGIYASLLFVLLLILFEILLSGGLSLQSLLTRQAQLGQGGFTGGYEEPAVLAIYFCIILPIALYLYFSENGTRWHGVIILFSIVFLVLTFTRAALGIMLLDIVLILILLKISLKKKLFLFISLGLMFLLFLIILEQRTISSEQYSVTHSIDFLGFSLEVKGGLLQRLSSSIDALQLLNNPYALLIGKGALSEILFWNNLSELTLSQLNPVSSIGNGILTFILYFGLIAFLLYAYFINNIVQEIRKTIMKNTHSIWLLLVPINFFFHLLLAQGGFIGYGYFSHFPGWQDLDFIYFSGNDGIQFLPTNMLIISIFFGLGIAHAIGKPLRIKDNDL